MKKLLSLATLFLLFLNLSAQDPNLKEVQGTSERKLGVDTTHISGWRKGGVATLGFAQGSSSNWAAGAEKFSLSVAATVSLFANLKSGKFSWRNTLDLGYALVNTTSQGIRKTDDKIDLYSKLGYDLSKTVSVGVVGNFRTQFTNGYDYDYLGAGLRRRTSDFMAPAYAIFAPGFDWHPTSYFSIFISPVSARWVLVTNDPKSYQFTNGVIPDSLKTPASGDFEKPLAILYGVDPARKVRAEIGGFASVNFAKEVAKNVMFKSRLDLYSNYLKTYRFEVTGPDQLAITKVDAKPQNVDVFWTNLLVLKVNKWLNVNYGFDLIYDDDVRQFGADNNSAATQIRSQLTVGVTTPF